jgi:hypothetical protein
MLLNTAAHTLAGVFGLILLAALAGHVLRRFLGRGLFNLPELDIFHGLLLIVTLLALVVTKGQTILWVFIIYLFGSISGQSKQQTQAAFHWHGLLFASLFALLPWLFFMFSLFRDGQHYFYPFFDESFYSKVAAVIHQTGVESSNTIVPWDGTQVIPSLYHYFEIWITLACYYFFKVPVIHAYKLVCIPVLMGVSLLQLQTLFRWQGLGLWLSMLIPAVFLFSGFPFNFYTLQDLPIPQTIIYQASYMAEFVTINRIKMAVILLFITAFLLSWHKNKQLSIFILVLLAFLWISLFVSMLSAVGLYVLVAEKGNLKTIVRKYYPVLLGAILLFVNYFFIYVGGFKEPIFLIYNSPTLIGGTFIYGVLTHSILLLPLLIADWLIYRTFLFKRIGYDVLWLSLPMLVGLGLHAISVGFRDSFQFIVNYSAAIIPLCYLLYLVRLIIDKPTLKFKLLTASFLLSGIYFSMISVRGNFEIYSRFSTFDFFDGLPKFLESNPPKTFRTVSLSAKGVPFATMPVTNADAIFLLHENPRFSNFQINGDRLIAETHDSIFSQLLLRDHYLNFKRKLEKNSGQKISPVIARIKFIEKYKPDFIVVAEGVDIRAYPELNIFLGNTHEDSKTGLKLIQLVYP